MKAAWRGWQNYGNNCRKQNVFGLQHQQKAGGARKAAGKGEGCGLNDIFSGGRRRSVRLLISRNPQQKHTAARTNDEADKKCVDSSFSTMGIVLGSRVKAGWEERGVWVGWLSFIFKHIEKQLKSKHSK